MRVPVRAVLCLCRLRCLCVCLQLRVHMSDRSVTPSVGQMVCQFASCSSGAPSVRVHLKAKESQQLQVCTCLADECVQSELTVE
ncbi:uncharacterized protein B0H18DRAFT_1024128 [Fomitopsis serialis]|uniref:uncharacterized protein n=1 Tax=Fomitopsis serialis TaxID=139415 RepID=UPI00200882E3|nr:uncharacterized protein B0H18DRAFT_1024128 [Neoantrodia serialis]KAH9920465.1 hypothetical protein B0H18DRAFT_1024128 [Neoantrodia serialis]